jgi:SAM-dependent methyltransferase
MGQPPEWAKSAVIGGEQWSDGLKHLAFLQSQGLKPTHSVLDLACGPLRTGQYLIRHLHTGRYTGVDNALPLINEASEFVRSTPLLMKKRPTLLTVEDFNLDLAMPFRKFDVAWSYSLFTHLSPKMITRCLRAVRNRLKPGGRYFASFNKAAQPKIGAKHQRWNHLTTAHYPPAVIGKAAQRAGMTFEIVSGPLSQCYLNWGQPHLQNIALFCTKS